MVKEVKDELSTDALFSGNTVTSVFAWIYELTNLLRATPVQPQSCENTVVGSHDPLKAEAWLPRNLSHLT